MSPKPYNILFRISIGATLIFFVFFLVCAVDVHNCIPADYVTTRVLWGGLWSALTGFFLLLTIGFYKEAKDE